MIIRDPKGWRMCIQDAKTGKIQPMTSSAPCSDANIAFSDDGKYFAVIIEDAVQIYKSSKCKLVCTLKHERVRRIYFSPKNSYAVSFAHQRKEDQNGNCWVWKWSKKESKLIHHFVLTDWVDDAVPMCFSIDEFIATQVDRGRIIIFDPHKLSTTKTPSDAEIHSIDAEKAVSVSIAPSSPTASQIGDYYYLAIFARATKYKLASVIICKYFVAKNKSLEIAQLQYLVIDECRLWWNPRPNGTIHKLLVITSCDTDTFGQSYYGKQEVYLLSTDSSNWKKIELQKKLQDVAWHPFGHEFVFIDDHPRKISVMNSNGELVHCIGNYTRNAIRFSDCGHFLWLGGFGNLTGEMSFYDYKKIKNENEGLKGFNKSDCARVYEFSPDASVFTIASLYPFMTVDNGFTVYKYNGVKLYEERVEKLFQIAYRPSLYHVYPEKVISAKALKQSQPIPKSDSIADKGPSGSKEEKRETLQKKKKYVPPHLRNAGTKKKAKVSKSIFG